MTDREKLIEVVRRAANACLPSNTEEFHLRMFVTHLLANGVTVQKHGRWIVTQEYNDVLGMDIVKYTCSVCGEYRLTATGLSQATDYCPNCGARMDGK